MLNLRVLCSAGFYGSTVNVMPLWVLFKTGKILDDIHYVQISFTGQTEKVLWLSVLRIKVGSKMINTGFFIIEGETSYNELLGKDLLHFNYVILYIKCFIYRMASPMKYCKQMMRYTTSLLNLNCPWNLWSSLLSSK